MAESLLRFCVSTQYALSLSLSPAPSFSIATYVSPSLSFHLRLSAFHFHLLVREFDGSRRSRVNNEKERGFN